jgi:phage baseplate assembly protein W
MAFNIDAKPIGRVYGTIGLQQVWQNVNCLLNTRVGDVPMHRAMGINIDFIDKPIPVAKAEVSRDIILQVRQYEPRLNINAFNFNNSDSLNGNLIPNLTVEVNL